MSSVTTYIPNSADIDRAAEKAHPLFLLNQWTWRGDAVPPTVEDLAAQFSSLAWSLDLKFADKQVKGPNAQVNFAASGRLMVTRMQSPGENGYVQYIYSVTV